MQSEPGNPISADTASPVPHQVVSHRAGGQAHSARPLRWRRVAAVTGLTATVAALAIGAFALSRGTDGPDTQPSRVTGPTARHITVPQRSPSSLPNDLSRPAGTVLPGP